MSPTSERLALLRDSGVPTSVLEVLASPQTFWVTTNTGTSVYHWSMFCPAAVLSGVYKGSLPTEVMDDGLSCPRCVDQAYSTGTSGLLWLAVSSYAGALEAAQLGATLPSPGDVLAAHARLHATRRALFAGCAKDMASLGLSAWPELHHDALVEQETALVALLRDPVARSSALVVVACQRVRDEVVSSRSWARSTLRRCVSGLPGSPPVPEVLFESWSAHLDRSPAGRLEHLATASAALVPSDLPSSERDLLLAAHAELAGVFFRSAEMILSACKSSSLMRVVGVSRYVPSNLEPGLAEALLYVFAASPDAAPSSGETSLGPVLDLVHQVVVVPNALLVYLRKSMPASARASFQEPFTALVPSPEVLEVASALWSPEASSPLQSLAGALEAASALV